MRGGLQTGMPGVWLALGLLMFSLHAPANPVQTAYSRVELLAEQATLPTDGGAVTVGLRIEPNPGWHVYWANPGDAGLPATMRWSLPTGFAASEFQFPAPHVIPFGDLVTYGFNEPVLLLSEVSVPSRPAGGEAATLAGSALWVVCDDELCVPDRASLALTLPIGEGADAPHRIPRFSAARAKLPKAVDWPVHFEFRDNPSQSARQAGDAARREPGMAALDQAPRMLVTVQTPQRAADLRDPYLFVESRNLVEYGQQTAAVNQNHLVFSMAAGNRADSATGFQAVLTYADDAGTTHSVQLRADRLKITDAQARSATISPQSETPSRADAEPDAEADSKHATSIPWHPSSTHADASGERGRTPSGQTEVGSLAPEPSAAGMSLATALLFAFIGGVILNLMPCVFPVLSIKALSLVSTAHANSRLARQSGLLYTSGILVAFSAIGVVLVFMREAGQAVGWGFQLQSPLVNLGLALLMLAIGLNLLGVYEIGARAAGIGQSLTLGDERKSSFFTGLLAVVVATPCTAPFMAGALGYALMQPAPAALGIFLALGLGLAFPYLLVSFVPKLGRLLPRPGAWMAQFRNLLAFPMFATAVWLLWVLGKQLGVDSMALGLLATLLLALALWAYGRAQDSPRTWAWGCFAGAALIAALATGGAIERHKAKPAAPTATVVGTLGQLELERFTPARLADYVAVGLPTFAYFTADWCVNCKLNERVALASDTVGRAFRERGIKVLMGDWTNEDPVISEWLNRYGRAGVPLYLYFPAGSTLDDARVLPQVLLPEIVVRAVSR